jgi:type IV secretion system protein VirB6
MEFFTNLFADIDAMLIGFYISHILDVMEYVGKAITVMAIILVICQGITLMMGWTDQPAKPLIMALFTITIISVLAGSVTKYNLYIGDFLRALPDDLVGLMLGNGLTIGEALDQFSDSILGGIQELLRNSSGVENTIIAGLVSILFFVFWVAMVVAAAFALITSKIILTILVIVGPFFILTLMFPATKDYFSKWLTYCISMSFLALLVGGVVGITNDFALIYFDQFGGGSDIDFVSFAGPAVVLCGLFKLFNDSPNIASSLSGGIGLSVGSSIARVMSKAAAPVISPASKAMTLATERVSRPISQNWNAKKHISMHKTTAAIRKKQRDNQQAKPAPTKRPIG